MPAVRRLVSFAIVGGFTTLLYAGLAALFSLQWHWPAVLGSAVAYTICALVSYAGNRIVTFQSAAPVAAEASRFVLTSIFGYTLAALIPLVLTDIAKFDATISICAVCITIPAANYIILSRFVFARSAGEQVA